jgi:hypothetical protein
VVYPDNTSSRNSSCRENKIYILKKSTARITIFVIKFARVHTSKKNLKQNSLELILSFTEAINNILSVAPKKVLY